MDPAFNFNIITHGTVTNFKYSSNGSLLAIADSEGYVMIYERNDKTFSKIDQFRADESSVWGLSWADPKFGNILGIGSLKNKMAVFQQSTHGWKQIAYHDLHEATVNCVEWSPSGLKLYGARSDGNVSILQICQKQWKYSAFKVSEASIVSLYLQPVPFGQIIAPEQQDSYYSRIVTASKDHCIRIWAHTYEEKFIENTQYFSGKKENKCNYVKLKEIGEKQTIKNIIWRSTWGTSNDSIQQASILYCTQEGNVKQILLKNSEKEEVKCILKGEIPCTRISQSLTGNHISVSKFLKDKTEIVLLREQNGEWKIIKKDDL